MESLADYLGVNITPQTREQIAPNSLRNAPDKLSGTEFCEHVTNSPEFRQYIVNGLILGNIPPAVLTRVMDHSWGKPVEQLEVKDKTNLLDQLSKMSPEELENRAMELAMLARQLRDKDSAVESVTH